MSGKLRPPTSTVQFVSYSVNDGIAWLSIDRPDAHNALNEAVITQLHAAVYRALDDPQIRGLAIAGEGKSFVAGADLKFFVRGLISGDLDRLIRFSHAGHSLLNTIASSPKPVIARVHGVALGGGVELALACHSIVAAPTSRFALPETGLGIYPGLGGTQRTPRRIGVGLAKWLIYTGHTMSTGEAWRIGLVDCVVPADQLDTQVRELINADLPRNSRPPLSPEHRALESLFTGHRLEELLGNPSLDRSARQLARKAPLALKFAEQLIDRGVSLSLAEGLQLELDHLREIFSTEDASMGLSTLGKRVPVFIGR